MLLSAREARHLAGIEDGLADDDPNLAQLPAAGPGDPSAVVVPSPAGADIVVLAAGLTALAAGRSVAGGLHSPGHRDPHRPAEHRVDRICRPRGATATHSGPSSRTRTDTGLRDPERGGQCRPARASVGSQRCAQAEHESTRILDQDSPPPSDWGQ
jgi:hypothetical protein